MRRNEVLGLRWDDIDFDRATIALNRGLVSVGYQLHETRGKTRNAPRPIDLDATTLGVLRAWRSWQHAEQHAVGIDGADGSSPTAAASPSTPPSPKLSIASLDERACP